VASPLIHRLVIQVGHAKDAIELNQNHWNPVTGWFKYWTSCQEKWKIQLIRSELFIHLNLKSLSKIEFYNTTFDHKIKICISLIVNRDLTSICIHIHMRRHRHTDDNLTSSNLVGYVFIRFYLVQISEYKWIIHILYHSILLLVCITI
jgi:5-methylcytosine-specific restriction endonuclease McrA